MPKTTPKKAVKKDPMTLPKKLKESDLVFHKSNNESYDGAKKTVSNSDGCEKMPDNYDRDAELMTRAAGEIKNLREHNRHMTTRLDMFDKMYSLFTNNNGRYGVDTCCGSDIASNLEYRAAERKEELKSSKPQ